VWNVTLAKSTVARDTSFSYSFLVLPADQRRAIGAVWDFCRAVDDAVDEASDNTIAAAQVIEWRAEVARVFGSDAPVTPQGQQLKPFATMFSLSRQPFDDLVDGVEMDLHRSRYQTIDELIEYCRRVASAVGVMCIEVFGCRDSRSREYAFNLGLALQITNIIRDIKADLAQGRVYLPQDDLAQFGVTEQMLSEGRMTDPIRKLLAFESQRARQFFAAAQQAMPHGEARKLVAAEIMGGIYFEILQRIERRGYDVFTERVRVPKLARARIALQIWAMSQLSAFGLIRSARA
jgi:phytoene synthase